jgi:hypothetical protein
MALMIVVLTVAALAILATPFIVSMRLQERSSRFAVAQSRARYATTAAYTHALSQLLQATHEYAEMAISFDDLTGEFTWRQGQRSVILDAEIQDEQGKINLNVAPEHQMAQLFADADIRLGLTAVQAGQLAAAVENYRSTYGAFPTIDELLTRGAVTAPQLDALRPYVTVHSITSDDGGSAAVNINTASRSALRAALSGVRARYVEPDPGDTNAGTGAMSVVELPAAATGVWRVQCTAAEQNVDTDVKRFTFSITSYPEGDPSDTTDHGTIELDEAPNSSGAVKINIDGVTFSIHNGTTDFAVDDTFTFSAERFSYDRTTFNPAKVNALLVYFRAVVQSADVSAQTITLDDASVFPAAGWVRINGDLIQYASRSATVLQGCTDITVTPGVGDGVIRIVPDMQTLADVLAEAVTAGVIRSSDRAALLANAKDPDTSGGDAALHYATGGLCFLPSGRYSIEATGSINDAAGRELRRMRVRRIVALESGSETAVTLDEQAEFDRAAQVSGSAGVITLPNPTYLGDVPPATGTDNVGLRLAPIVETDKGWGFDTGPLFGATTGVGLGDDPIAALGGITLTPGTNLYVNGDKGVLVAGTDAVRVFAPPADLNVDGSTRRVMLWVKPTATFSYSAEHVFLDTGPAETADGDVNRIRISYSAAGKLVFKIADEADEPRSAEIQGAVSSATFARSSWHRIEAVWSGLDIGQMALMLNGRVIGGYSPSGSDAEQKASPSITGEEWVARVGNYIKTSAGAARDTQIGATAGPTSVYGYGTSSFINKDASTTKLAFNKVHRGGASTSGGFGQTFVTAIKIPAPVLPAVKETKITAAALIIPVADVTELPDEGYVKIGSEIIKYDSKSAAMTDALGATYYELTVPADGRGCDFGVGDLATKFESNAAEHNDAAQVICVSLKVTSNANYPMPQLLDVPGNVESYFDLNDLDPNTCSVQVEDEWISYTHRGGTEFLVHVQAKADDRDFGGGSMQSTSSMRGVAGTVVASHNTGLSTIPVYEVTAGGRLGAGDRVSLLDDSTAAGDTDELAVKHAVSSRFGYLVSFPDFIPSGLNIYIKKGTVPTVRNARVVKFPSGRYRPRRLLGIGCPVDGAGGRAESTIGCVRLYNHSGSNNLQRIKDAIDGTSSGGFDVRLGLLDALHDTGATTEWGWIGGSGQYFGVASWPVTGYVNIGGEAFLYKVRYPHNISYSSSLGAMSNSAGVSISTAGGIPAEDNIVWTRQGAENDPITAGFNPYGGYLIITSYTRTAHGGTTKKLEDCTDEILQWLITNGHVTQEFVDANGTKDPVSGLWSFPEITTEGGFNTSEKREYVFYSSITPSTPGANTYTFNCDATGRHLYDSHEDPTGIALGHAAADDGEGGLLYPRLTARTVAMAVLHRGGAAGTLDLGTSKSARYQGARVLPMPNLPVTMMNGAPVDEDNNSAAAYEGDRLRVESTAGFPTRGYLEITNSSGGREIIYYTGVDESTIAGADPVRKQYYFTGIQHFRGRFGTTPIDLSGLSAFTDARNTSTSQISAYSTERRAVRLFRPRFPDRMPLLVSMTGGAETAREYAPHATGSDLVYFETTKTVRGANWTSINWTEDLPAGTDVIVLARVGSSPDWGTGVPVKWNAVTSGGGRVIYKFDTADADNTINATGDTITVRVYFKFNPGYDLSVWQVPTLKSLTVNYKAGPRVIESEVLDH